MDLSAAKGGGLVRRQLRECIPADSEVVLYLACGDGSDADALRQAYPRMRVIGVETDAALRQSAVQRGLFVAESAAAALTHMEQTNGVADAWIMDRRAWLDETLTRSCRSRLMSRLRRGAALAWEVANSQYWRYVLDLLQGQAEATPRHSFRALAAELQASGVAAVQLLTPPGGSGEEFDRFLAALPLLAPTLTLDTALAKTVYSADSFILQGWYETEAAEPWTIITVLGETRVCARVRVDEPHALLSRLPQVVCHSMETADRIRWNGQGRLLWIWQRRLYSFESMVTLQRQLLQHGALTIQEWDDDPLQWEKHFRQSRFIELRSAHAIQTSTPALAEYLREFHPEVKIFPNCITALPALRLVQPAVPTIFFGALNRQQDWAPLMPTLNRVLKKLGRHVRVQVVFDKEFFAAVQCEQKEFAPLCAYPRYQELLRQSDVALLPLLPTRFNKMKSDLKFLECAAASTAVLASTTVYADTVRHGMTGLLYETEAQFRDGLEQLLEDVTLRHTIIRNAHRWVGENRLLSLHYRDRLRWYKELFSRYGELTDAIGERVPELRQDRR